MEVLQIIFVLVIFPYFVDVDRAPTTVFDTARNIICDPDIPKVGINQRVQGLRHLAVLQRIDGKNADAEQTLRIAKEIAETETKPELRQKLLSDLENPQTAWQRPKYRSGGSPFLRNAIRTFNKLGKAGKLVEAIQSLNDFAAKPEFQPLLTEISQSCQFIDWKPIFCTVSPAEAMRFVEMLKTPEFRTFFQDVVRRSFLQQEGDVSFLFDDFSIRQVWNDARLNHKDDDGVNRQETKQPETYYKPNLEEMLDLVTGFKNANDRITYYFLIANNLIDETLDYSTYQLRLENLDNTAFQKVIDRYEKELEELDKLVQIDPVYSDENKRPVGKRLTLANLYLKAGNKESALRTLHKIETEFAKIQKRAEKENEQKRTGQQAKPQVTVTFSEVIDFFERDNSTIDNSTKTIFLHGEHFVPNSRFSYGEQAWLAGSYLKAGDQNSYQHLRQGLSDLPQPSGCITTYPISQFKLYEWGDIFCGLELFEEAINEWAIDDYDTGSSRIRRLLERTWCRAAGTGKETELLNFVRKLPDHLGKIILLDELAKRLDETEKTENAQTIYREIVEMTQTFQYFEKAFQHPFVRVTLNEKDYRTTWKRVEILFDSIHSFNIEDDLAQDFARNFAETFIKATTDAEFERAYRHAAAIQCYDMEVGAFGYIAVRQYQLGKIKDAEQTLKSAYSKIDNEPAFQFMYKKIKDRKIYGKRGLANLIDALLYMERFDEAIQLYRQLPRSSLRRDTAFEHIFRSLCYTGQKDKALDFLQEFGRTLGSSCGYISGNLLYRFYNPELPDVDSAMYKRLQAILSDFYKKNVQADAAKTCRRYRELAEIFETFGDRETALQSYQKAVFYTKLIPKETFEYQYEIKFLAQDIMVQFGRQAAEEAYCQSITVLKNNDSYDIIDEVINRVEEYLDDAQQFTERQLDKPHSDGEKTNTDQESPMEPDEWKRWLLRDFPIRY
jgi:hypothetical protein